MIKKSLLAFVIAASSVYGGCADEKDPIADSKPELGTMSLALTQTTTSGRTYRLAGTLNVLVHDPRTGTKTVIQSFQLNDQTGPYFTASLRPATYDFGISNFSIFVTQNGVEADVTGRATLATNTATVTIVKDQNANVSFSFSVAGEVVVFNPCNAPNSLVCATHDNDGDGILNGVECPSGTMCVDTDNDGSPDANDADSDGDGYEDGSASETDRLNACLPYAYANNCTAANAGSGSASVEVQVTETCDAGGQDTCSFGPDAGATTATDAGSAVVPPPYPFAYEALNPSHITVKVDGQIVPQDGYIDLKLDDDFDMEAYVGAGADRYSMLDLVGGARVSLEYNLPVSEMPLPNADETTISGGIGVSNPEPHSSSFLSAPRDSWPAGYPVFPQFRSPGYLSYYYAGASSGFAPAGASTPLGEHDLVPVGLTAGHDSGWVWLQVSSSFVSTYYGDPNNDWMGYASKYVPLVSRLIPVYVHR